MWATLPFALLSLGAKEEPDRSEWNRRYLEKYKFQKGVTTLPSGLMYKVIEPGGGKRHPTRSTDCLVHYEGRVPFVYETGKRRWQTFDSSYKRGEPNTFAPDGVIKGWSEAMLMMVEGDKWDLAIPSNLAYGDDPAGEWIKPGDTLFFTLELIEIKGQSVPASRLRGEPDAIELTDLTHYEEWAEEARPPMILGVFRQPVYGQKLLSGMRGAQKYLSQAGGASSAFYAQSRFDSKTGQYTRSELEEALELEAPAIYTSMGDVGRGTHWSPCNGVRLKNVQTSEDVTRAIIACARAEDKNEL